MWYILKYNRNSPENSTEKIITEIGGDLWEILSFGLRVSR